MQLIFLHDKGRHYPVLFCDVCHQRITDAGMAMLKYDDVDQPAILCHKGSCDRNSPDLLYWHELDTALVWLEGNIGFKRKEASAKAKLLSSL